VKALVLFVGKDLIEDPHPSYKMGGDLNVGYHHRSESTQVFTPGNTHCFLEDIGNGFRGRDHNDQFIAVLLSPS